MVELDKVVKRMSVNLTQGIGRLPLNRQTDKEIMNNTKQICHRTQNNAKLLAKGKKTSMIFLTLWWLW